MTRWRVEWPDRPLFWLTRVLTRQNRFAPVRPWPQWMWNPATRRYQRVVFLWCVRFVDTQTPERESLA